MPKLLVTLCLCGLALPLSAQSKYANRTYGISLLYPKGYILKEGDLGDKDLGLGYLGPIPMEFAMPGGIRVMTVEPPVGSYPGTDFVNAFFTFSVNRHLTRQECQQFPGDTPGSGVSVTKKIRGVEFQGLRQGAAGLGHQFGGTYYHAFLRGSCYEFGYGIATSGYGTVHTLKKVEERNVFGILERILQSVKIIRAYGQMPGEMASHRLMFG